MLLADVNLFIYAHRPESPRFDEHKTWLTDALSGDEPFGISEQILSGFLRIVTNHRVFRDPTPPDVALDFCQTVLTAPSGPGAMSFPTHFWRPWPSRSAPPSSPRTPDLPVSPGSDGVAPSTPIPVAAEPTHAPEQDGPARDPHPSADPLLGCSSLTGTCTCSSGCRAIASLRHGSSSLWSACA